MARRPESPQVPCWPLADVCAEATERCTDSFPIAQNKASLKRAAAKVREAGKTDDRMRGRSGSAPVTGGCRAMARHVLDERMK